MADAIRIEKWIKQLDIDYYSYFIKSWIPFNSWYRDNYNHLNSDRAVINEIKRTGNRFRDTIVLLLNDQGPEGVLFRASISNLHNALNSVPISCKQKYKDDYYITLTEICVENNPSETIRDRRNNITYFVRRDRRNDSITVSVKDSSGNDKLALNLDSYSEDDLQAHGDFLRLTDTQKSTLLNFLRQINPWYPCNLLYDETRDEEATRLNCGNTHFTSDRLLLAKGIIECLYLLRNSLLHGELTPNDDALSVYKAAYDISSSIVKKLS